MTKTDGLRAKDKNESARFRCNVNIKTEKAKKYFKDYLCRLFTRKAKISPCSTKELKYVKRVQSDQDRRSKFLELTPSGKKIMAAIEKIRTASEAEFLSPLTKQEQTQLRGIVRKLLG